MRGFLRRHLRVIAGTAVAGLGVTAALAVATVPDSARTIHGCIITIAGSNLPAPGANLRVIDTEPPASQTCDPAQHETPLDWNQQGAQGPQGPAGTAGQEGGAQECRAAVGHLTLKGSPALSSDVCEIRLVKIGSSTSAHPSAQAGSTEFEVVRRIDATSPKLSKATVQGTIFKSATLQVYKPGTTTVQSTLKLSNAAISSYKVGMGLNQPLETLTIIAIGKKGA